MTEYTEKQNIEYLETQIDACGSATGMLDAAIEVRYQIRARPTENLADLQKAYETIRRYTMAWAGADSEDKTFDALVDSQVSL